MSDIIRLSAEVDALLHRFEGLAASPEVQALGAVDAPELTRATGAFSLAVVGQYSAGKSSLIAALTGEAVDVGADVTTADTAVYEHRGLHLIDTPGVQSGRREHDEIAVQALMDADLIAFVTTIEGMDEAGRRWWAELSDRRFKAGQLVLIVNKLSAGTATVDVLQAELERELGTLDLPVVYCDARDAIDARDCSDPDLADVLRRESRIDEVETVLDDFARRVGAFGRVLSPISRALVLAEELIESAENVVVDSDERADEAVAAADRVDDAVVAFEQRVRAEARKLRDAVVNEARGMVDSMVDPFEESTFEAAVDRWMTSVERLLPDADQVFLSAQDALHRRVNTATAAFSMEGPEPASIEGSRGLERPAVGLGPPAEQKNASEPAGKLFKQGKQWVLRGLGQKLDTGTSPGEPLHTLVHHVGHRFNYRFKPHEVVKHAKHAKLMMKGVHFVAAHLDELGDAYASFQDWKRERQVARAREDLTASVRSAAASLADELQARSESASEPSREIAAELRADSHEARTRADRHRQLKADLARWNEEAASVRDTLQAAAIS